MKIMGLQKLTLLDYPGRVACTVFLGRCNFYCPFCHNSHLLGPQVPAVMEEEELFSFLDKRRGILDGVCVTGGEPTIHPQLPEFLKRLREMGYRVKLDTNGYRPDVLSGVVKAGLVDYVAMDVKNSPEEYAKTVGLERPELAKLEESIRFLLEDRVDYELRTTVVHPLHTGDSIRQMARWVGELSGGKRVRRWFIQPFADRETVPGDDLSAPDQASLELFLDCLAPYGCQVELRGV